MTKIGAVSVDLDEIGCYRALHGLPVRDEAARAVGEVALPRMARFARAQGVPLTVFAVGCDLLHDGGADALRQLLAEADVEVENHSFSHRYDLSRLARPAIAAEVRRGAEAIAEVTGRRVEGFRAPGYLVSDALFDALADVGVRFDASIFPCPPYVLAKLLALGAMQVRGRRSAAIAGDPRMMMAPPDPYRPGRPWYRPGSRPFVELPMAVTRRLRLPLIGTSAVLAGEGGARRLARGCLGRPLVSFELHGIDFLDRNDGLEDLTPHQPDVRVSVADKLHRLGAVIETLKTGGYRFTTLSRAASALGA